MMNLATGENLFARALDRHKAGSLLEAEAAYRALLDSAPDHAGGWHGLGALLLQRGNLEGARELMKRAVDLDRSNAAFRYNLSLALCGLGQRLAGGQFGGQGGRQSATGAMKLAAEAGLLNLQRRCIVGIKFMAAPGCGKISATITGVSLLVYVLWIIGIRSSLRAETVKAPLQKL